jgi:hypothetical protein
MGQRAGTEGESDPLQAAMKIAASGSEASKASLGRTIGS